MRYFLFLFLLTGSLLADFYIISKDKKVKMTEFETGQIDFAWFGDFASIHREDDELHAMGDEIAFNHKHLNFRIATIDIPQSNTSLTEYSQKSSDASDKYYIDFAKHKREDGAMLQLFYHNKWYGVILGDPKEALYTLFGRDDLASDKAIEGLQRALLAFENDSYLQERLAFYKKKKAGEKQVPAEYKKQIPIDFKNLPKPL
jgi:hypothetical protein